MFDPSSLLAFWVFKHLSPFTIRKAFRIVNLGESTKVVHFLVSVSGVGSCMFGCPKLLYITRPVSLLTSLFSESNLHIWFTSPVKGFVTNLLPTSELRGVIERCCLLQSSIGLHSISKKYGCFQSLINHKHENNKLNKVCWYQND